MNLWHKFGCFITGWNSELLAQSSAASRSKLSKYTSALIILMLIWSVTGFCFAKRYIGLPIWGCCLVSLCFVTIIIMVERQIILTHEKNKSVLAFRFIIAGLMAVVGSAIFDQTLFGKDIDKQMIQNIENQVAEIVPQRLHTIDGKLKGIKTELDSLNAINASLQTEVDKNPFIVQKSVTSSKNQVAGASKNAGTPTVTVTKNEVENPKIKEIETNNNKIEQLKLEDQKYTDKRMRMEDETRAEIQENVGFLEELEAMIQLLSNHRVALIFYLLFFGLLMSLELFIVMSKINDKECDYEALVKRTEEIRMAQMRNIMHKTA